MADTNAPHPEEEAELPSRTTYGADPKRRTRQRRASQQLALLRRLFRAPGLAAAAQPGGGGDLAVREFEGERRAGRHLGGADDGLALGVAHHGVTALQHIFVRQGVAVEPAAEILQPLAALADCAPRGAVEPRRIVGEALARPHDLAAQHIDAQALGETGNPAPLQREEMAGRAPGSLCEGIPPALPFAHLLTPIGPPSRQRPELTAATPQPRR